MSTTVVARDANEIADALGKPRPTPEQRAVIEAPLRPALVVAGAGSGKTETMANRVLWLLANGLVSPAQVLGLTFTRKAAGELAERIEQRIQQLGAAGLIPSLHGGGDDAAPDLAEHDPFEAPTVSTYNAFANSIFRDNAVLIGREGDATVLGESSAWHLARSIVLASSDERMADFERGIDSITDLVVDLAHELGDNLADPDAVARYAEQFVRIAELPRGGRGSGLYSSLREPLAALTALPVLVDLAKRFAEAKAERGFVEFSDQINLALEVVQRSPRVIDEHRERFRVILLDEYQDTSVIQTRLLATLFRGQAVMGVGDPHQSIYGWRGASAANLGRFAVDFAADPADRYSLSTSWRNGHGILAAANAIVEPLTAASPVAVDALVASPIASGVPLVLSYPETVEEEADAVASWFAARLHPDAHPPGAAPPSAAMLFRVRKHMDRFAAALTRQGVPFHILGIGGLLRRPEIVDLVCALTVIDDPTAGSELVRLLAGTRWRIGVRDLHALRGLSSWLAERDHAQRLLPETVRERLRASVAEGEGGAIIDALDFITTRRDDDHSAFEAFTPTGLARLRDAGAFFARLRARTGLDLIDFVILVEQELMLDIEVEANELRTDGRANLEAFLEAAGDFLQTDDRSSSAATSLRGFLRWLVLADKRDGIGPRPEEPEPGTVQLLTIHGSKGLEWDLVAVPRLVHDELPGKPREGYRGWLRYGAMPYAFRGDAAELPDLEWRTAETQKDVVDAQERFAGELLVRHVAEERRLGYVAITRARHELHLSGSFWGEQAKPRGPSLFLRELESARVIPPLPEASEHEENPVEQEARTFSWPHDPLGPRRAAVERAALAVASAEPGLSGARGDEIALLLAERDERLRAAELVPLPTRIPASRFKDFLSEPALVAAQLRRPMPERPYRQTRLGTEFHSWVEQRSGVRGAADDLDASGDELDLFGETTVDGERLAELQTTFERSEWGSRRPEAVEIEIHLALGAHIVVCKIDAVYVVDAVGEPDADEPDAGGPEDETVTDAGAPAARTRYQIVDWKTGKAPRNARDLELKQTQLALYRLAFARWKGIDVELVDAVFYFVADDVVVRPERFYSERELVEGLESAATPGPGSARASASASVAAAASEGAEPVAG